MIAITGIAYGTSRTIVASQAPDPIAMRFSCWPRKSMPQMPRVMTKSQNAGWRRWKKPVWVPQLGAGSTGAGA